MYVLWILLIPLCWLLVAKYLFRSTFNWKELGISMVATSIVVVVTWQVGKHSQTQDFEIWNGYVTDKQREHDKYVRSYQCNCRQSCSGTGSSRSCTTICSTCYEDRYTVTWSAKTTIGSITFDHLDRSSRLVYQSPDPTAYKRCKKGEPASLEKSYTNYVKAVPDSLFHDDSSIESFKKKIPDYPRVYNFYHFDRVINVDSKIDSAAIKQINDNLDNELKTLGKLKQANILVVLTEIDDPTYRYAVEREWLSGKKNDIVVFVGLDGNMITWADVMTWALNSGNELFHVTLRDAVTEMKTLNADKFSKTVASVTKKLYDRPQMKDYEYLADDISPPTWVIILAIILSLGVSGGLTWYFHHNEI